MLKLAGTIILMAVLGEGQAVEALDFNDIALFSQPQKVSHRDYVFKSPYGRPFGVEGPRNEKVMPRAEDDFRNLAKAYRNLKPFVESVFEFERLDLLSGAASEKFWFYVNSPTYKGGLAMRPGAGGEKWTWPMYRDAYLNEPPLRLFRSGRFEEMSAAAKYDLLLGNDTVLWEREIRYAQKLYEKNGKVPKWAGICHGTAPASFSYPEPKEAVAVKAFDGSEIRFSKNDLKRLAAYIWGENRVEYAQVGGRCFSDVLGLRTPECLDTNPATFHLALLNYMGINKRTLIVDNAYDSMVWNRPVISFEYNYRHPLTKLPSRKLKYSLTPLEEFGEERKALAHKDAVWIVGVRMKVKLLYGDEREGAGEENTAYDIVYYYDLEIGREGKILGGEWETLYHPDFIWMVKEGSSPKTGEDNILKEDLWNGEKPLSEYARLLGRKAARRGDLMEYIVKSLIELSINQRSER